MEPNSMPEVISIDLETTGFSPVHNQIFEIGAVSSQGSEFQIFVKVQVPRNIQTLTGVSQAEVDAEGVTLHEACDAFKSWLSQRTSGAIWAGHRFKAFDFPFLLNAYKRCGYPAPVVPLGGVVDTLDWATSLGLQKKKLGDVYALACGKPLQGAHRATTDARAVIEILFSDWARLKWWPSAVVSLSALMNKIAKGSKRKRTCGASKKS
jgi:DNA polymerase-3 subunit alpha (Gram-positive type)